MAENSMGVVPKAGTTVFDFENEVLQKTGIGVVWLGDEPGGDPQHEGPLIMMASLPPNVPGDAHLHVADSVTIMIEGSIKINDKWYRPGQVRVQNANRAYGPTLTGPDGYKAVLIFADRKAAVDYYIHESARIAMADTIEASLKWVTRNGPLPDGLLDALQPETGTPGSAVEKSRSEGKASV